MISSGITRYQHFWFKGINSLEMGVYMLVAPPISRGKRNVNEITIPGRSGTLYEDLGTFSKYTKSIECHVMDKSQINKVCEWLVGYGEIIFSSEAEHVYRGFIKNQIDFDRVLRNINTFPLQFDVEPFKYKISPLNDNLTFTSNSTWFGKGNYFSNPIITIYGSNTCKFSLNDDIFTCSNVNTFVTINSEIEEVYKDDTSMNPYFYADNYNFPRLVVGENTIKLISGITKIEIVPNYRSV